MPRIGKTFVALLRGVNVGGRAMVSMAKLKETLASRGYEDVTTYIQSGNVVFRAAAGQVQVAEAIEQAVGVTAVVRTPAQLKGVVAHCPFEDVSKVHVAFLDRKPKAADVRRLDRDRSPGDEFRVRGSEIYLHLPNGVGRSKLTIDWFERQLGVRATVRNWRTVTKLLELAGA